MSIYRLDQLFAPKSVALVGASADPRSAGFAMAQNLLKSFKGRIDFVNPKRPVIGGKQAVSAVEELASPPDLAVVAVPGPALVPIVEQLAILGTKACAIITGARDRDLEGRDKLRAEIASIARPYGMRVVGPDCLGVIVPRIGLDASVSAEPAAAGDLALISEPATIVTTVIDWANVHSIGFSSIVTLGDRADVDFADCLDYFAQDYRTRAILLIIENILYPQKFMSAARAAARTKPVVVIKGGRYAQAVRPGSHAGKLATPDAVFDAAFRRAGLLRVQDLGELFDAAETLSRLKPFPGKRLAVITNGGGAGVLAVDRLVERGGTLAEIAPETIAALDPVMPPCWSRRNPLDVVGDAGPERYIAALEATLADKGVDAVMVMHCPTALADTRETVEKVIAAITAYRKRSLRAKPVLCAFLTRDLAIGDLFEAAKIPHYFTPHDAIDGFMHLVAYSEAQESLMETPPSLPESYEPDSGRARQVVAESLAAGRHWLDPAAVDAILKAYHIEAAPADIATTPAEAGQLARRHIGQGQSCVLKILSEDLPHKSDVGGVRLNLSSVEAVEDAAWGMLSRIRERHPEARLDGVTVHPMVKRPHAIEVFAGITDDPVFGPVVVFGRGGTAVEVVNDKALALPPLDMKLAHELIGRTRVHALLKGYRDRPPADLDQLAMVLVKLAQLSADVPEIREIDLNPLLVDENGVIAVDAKIAVARLEKPMRGQTNPRFAIRPYPKEWERWDVLKDGSRIFVRPVMPQDEVLYPDFLSEVTAEDLRLRFFAPIKEFSHAFIAKLTQIDYARAIAFIAIDDETGKMLGVVRLHADPNHETGEYAILLRSNLKGKGLGWLLMRRMIDYARADGIRKVKGQVLRENVTMLGMCERLGFEVKDDPDDQGIKVVTLDLGAARSGGTPPARQAAE